MQGAKGCCEPTECDVVKSRLSEHSILGSADLRHFLQNVPVLHDHSRIIDTEYFDPSVIEAARPDLVTIKDHHVAVGETSLDFDSLSGVLARHSFEIVNEPSLASRDMRIVLDVVVAGKTFDRLAWSAIVKDQTVNGDCIRLVSFKVVLDVFAPREFLAITVNGDRFAF